MTGTDPIRQPDAAAVQFMIVDFLAEISKFSESPSGMGQFLTRQLRELMGVRTVVMLQHSHDPLDGSSRIVAIEPGRARNSALIAGLVRMAAVQTDFPDSTFFLKSSAPSEVAAAMDILGISSLSMTPLRVGGLRVGTLFALDHLDFQRSDDVARLLSVLSPVFALILRNTLHFESQEAKVLKQAEMHRALLRTNLDGFVLVGGNGTVLDANEAYLRMTGYSLEEIQHLHMSDLEAVETRAETDLHMQKMKQVGSESHRLGRSGDRPA